MSEAGYTLTETLAAMAVISMAIGGYALGVQVISGEQGAVGATVRNAQATRAAQTWLERRFAERAPYRAADADRFSGSADSFHFDCGGPAPCDVEVKAGESGRSLTIFKGAGEPIVFRLPTAEPARFVYRGSGEGLSTWPPASGAHEALASVSLLQGEGVHQRALFEARIRLEQPLDCRFDTITQDCR